MVIPPSRTCLPMKLITTGAAMDSKVEIAPDDSPDSRLIAPVTIFSLFPNSDGTMRLPIAIKDEFGSVTLPAIWDHDTGPGMLETVSSILRNAPESSALLAKPAITVAIDASRPRATD